MIGLWAIAPLLAVSVLAQYQDIASDQKSSAELLLEALGEQNNEVDSDLGQLLYNFISSKEKTSVTPAQFLSTFVQSLTKESVIILLLAPAILAISSLFIASFSFPALLLRGLADWSVGFLDRMDRMDAVRQDQLLLQASQESFVQEETIEDLNQSPRFTF